MPIVRDRETKLMLQVKEGSKEAFEELYTLFQKPLANFLYRLCWNAQLVDDLVQDVFLRVWKAAPKYEPKAKVSTWIFKIAHNLWINYAAKRKEQALEGADREIDSAPDVDIQKEELRRAVKRAVEQLPEGEREVLVLAEYSGFKYHEISEILEIPVGTVKSRMFSATRRLREALQKHMKGDEPA